MNSFQGADPDQLLAHAERTSAAGERIEALAQQLVDSAAALEWTGPDAAQFRAELESPVAARLRSLGGQCDAVARALAGHAAEQELASSVDGRIDSEKYAALLGGEGFWSDVINGSQDVWNVGWNPFSTPLTIDELGGRYIDTDEGKDFDPAEVDLSPEAIRDQIMRQGSLGDCWFLSGLMSVAQANPEFLAQNITLREDGTWDVTLYEDGKPVVVNVAPDQLAADGARVDDDGSEVSWANDPIGYMSIFEQAAINHLGPDYESVIADTPGAGLELLTGQPSADDSFLGGNPTLDEFQTALAENRPITVMSDPIHPWRSDIAAAHVYQVTGIDHATGELILENPWGNTGEGDGDMPHFVRVSIQDCNANFVMAGVGAKPEDFGKAA